MNINEELITDTSNLKRAAGVYDTLCTIAEDYLRVIQDTIYEAHQDGKSAVVVTLPAKIDCVGFSNKTSQTFVYGSIVQLMLRKKYEVFIDPREHNCYLYLRWSSREDQITLETYKQIIDAHYRPLNDLS